MARSWQPCFFFFCKPAVQFGYSAAKVPSDIVKYLQGVPAEEIAKQGTLDLTKPPKIGRFCLI